MANLAETRTRITDVLVSLREAGPDAWERLVPLVYDGLRAIAHRQLRSEPEGARLGTTALVHEAFLKLVEQSRARWEDRGHFYAVASMAMRRILINEAHRRNAQKRGGGRAPVSLDAVDPKQLAGSARMDPELLIALDRALSRLEEEAPRQGRVVECRYFGGLTVAETAEALGVSAATVKRDWRVARAWLFREMTGTADG